MWCWFANIWFNNLCSSKQTKPQQTYITFKNFHFTKSRHPCEWILVLPAFYSLHNHLPQCSDHQDKWCDSWLWTWINTTWPYWWTSHATSFFTCNFNIVSYIFIDRLTAHYIFVDRLITRFYANKTNRAKKLASYTITFTIGSHPWCCGSHWTIISSLVRLSAALSSSFERLHCKLWVVPRIFYGVTWWCWWWKSHLHRCLPQSSLACCNGIGD